MTTFDDALAQALDRCGRGESPDSVAASFPEHDLLPYLRIAQRIKGTPSDTGSPSLDWMQRSLQRLLIRRMHEEISEN